MEVAINYIEINYVNWNRALYLKERKVDSSIPAGDTENPVLQWCGRTGLTKELLDFRLQEDGLDYHVFQKIIMGGHNQTVEYRTSDWYRTLEEILSLEQFLIEVDTERIDSAKSPFYPFMVPFMNWAKKKMTEQYREWKEMHPDMPFTISSMIPAVMNTVHEQIHFMSGRTLVYELNAARILNQLEGDTPEARFDFFVTKNLTSNQDIYRFLEKYPVLARLLSESTKNLVHSILETLNRFLEDYPVIVEAFTGDFQELLEIEMSEGDPHNSGRSVMILRFSSGNRLVYKPRTLAVDVHFQQFLSWMNDKGFAPAFQTLKILSRSDYGWEAYVEHLECKNTDEIIHFYQRMGGYLAVLYLLYETDFHFENVLAAGEHPFLIDVEALFQNLMPLGRNEDTALEKAAQILEKSVLRTGMLPISLFENGEYGQLEVSALGGHEGQELPREAYVYGNLKTDLMKLVKTKNFLQGGRNRPDINGEEVSAEVYVEEIAAGFRQVYGLFIQHREELAAKEGPLLAFADDPVRAVFRNTYNYSMILEASLHPNYLQDGLSRVQLFDFLWRAVESQPPIVRLVSSETADMLKGDVPMFISKVNSRDLWDVRGKRMTGFFKQPALELVFERLRALSLEDCEQQINNIHMSMSTIAANSKEVSWNKASALPLELPARKQLIESAVKIGDLILSEAVWSKDECSVCWIGLSTNESERLSFTPMDDSLYDGVLGMALFFAI